MIHFGDRIVNTNPPFSTFAWVDMQGFVGRVHELNQLRDWFSNPDHRLALIAGVAGSGKTALIWAFAGYSHHIFPGGIYFSTANGPESPAQFAQRVMPKRFRQRALLVIDNAECLSGDVEQDIRAILANQPKLNLLMAGRLVLNFADIDQLNIQLGGLREAEFRELIAKRLSATDRATAEKLWAAFNGSPLLAQLAGRTVREGILSLSELASKLTNFERPGILGPDGKPVTTASLQAKKIIADIKEVNDELLHLIKADPAVIYSLGSRKFEEIVAEILTRQGYHVDLTPASKDGGFDMYAARKDNLGEFLYLVECKKYAPGHKVGVEIVRALHGVVQQKRATAGLVATTSFFTKGAKEFRQEVLHQMKLADYVEFQSWLRGVVSTQSLSEK